MRVTYRDEGDHLCRYGHSEDEALVEVEMLITYDSEADVLYIELRQVAAEDSVDIEDGVTALLDGKGHIVGLEILDASERIGQDQLRSVTLKDLAWEPVQTGRNDRAGS